MAAQQPAHRNFMRDVVNPTLLGIVAHNVVSSLFGRQQTPTQTFGQLGVVKPFGSASRRYSPGHQNLYAHHASAAYGGPEENAALRRHGWNRDDDLSGPNHQTMVKNGEAVVAYRGTVLKNPGDLVADAFILAGKQQYSRRFYDGVDTAMKAARKYGANKVTLTGHSLGGAVASYAGKENSLPVVNYNPGTGIAPLKAFIKGAAKGNNVITYRVPTDIIAAGAGALGGKIYNIKQNAANAHTIKNFTSPLPRSSAEKAVMTAAHQIPVNRVYKNGKAAGAAKGNTTAALSRKGKAKGRAQR